MLTTESRGEFALRSAATISRGGNELGDEKFPPILECER
jgi:hypothetical protein